MLLKKCLAEYLGTFLLCFIGCGAAVLNDNPLSGPLIFVFLIIGLASGFGHISGAHFNASVSLAFLLRKQITILEFLFYIISQFLGAFCGFLLLYKLLSSLNPNEVKDLACNGYGIHSPKQISEFNAFFFEFFITCFFIYVILTNCQKKLGPFIIGCTLGSIAFFGGKLTGASMNPARSLAPALIMGGDYLKQVWVFIFAPLLGSIMGVIIYNILNCECKNEKIKKEKKENEEELVDLNEKA